MIRLVRRLRVILDTDLATLYAVPTKQLNQQLQRNRAKFPCDFAFQLNSTEWEALRSQIVTLKVGRGKHASICLMRLRSTAPCRQPTS